MKTKYIFSTPWLDPRTWCKSASSDLYVWAATLTVLRTAGSEKGTSMLKALEPLLNKCSCTLNPTALASSTLITPVEKVTFSSSTSGRKKPSVILNTSESATVSVNKKEIHLNCPVMSVTVFDNGSLTVRDAGRPRLWWRDDGIMDFVSGDLGLL